MNRAGGFCNRLLNSPMIFLDCIQWFFVIAHPRKVGFSLLVGSLLVVAGWIWIQAGNSFQALAPTALELPTSAGNKWKAVKLGQEGGVGLQFYLQLCIQAVFLK